MSEPAPLPCRYHSSPAPVYKDLRANKAILAAQEALLARRNEEQIEKMVALKPTGVAVSDEDCRALLRARLANAWKPRPLGPEDVGPELPAVWPERVPCSPEEYRWRCRKRAGQRVSSLKSDS